MEDKLNVISWVGPSSCKDILSVVLISSDLTILDCIHCAMVEVHAKGGFAWKLQTIRCRSLSDITKDVHSTGNVGIDFIVMALNTSKVFCLEWAKLQIKEIHPDLLRRRVVLVNASGLPLYEMAVESEALFALQEEFNFDLFNSNVYKYEDAVFLVKRLFTYFEAVVGIKTGYPNLNI